VRRLVVVGLLVALVASGQLAAGATQTVDPPTPVTASDFPVEPIGAAPSDGDGLIPNAATPNGAPVGSPTTCTVRFTAAPGGSTSALNAWIATHQSSSTSSTVVCLSGVFHGQVRVWNKVSHGLLEIAPAPGAVAAIEPGTPQASFVDPNQYWSDAGAVSVVDSRDVEIYGLTVSNYRYNGPSQDPVGIYVATRSDTTVTSPSVTPHRSACFVGANTCADIYIINNHVIGVANTADSNATNRTFCNNSTIAAYAIDVLAAGSSTSPALEHLVIEGNVVSGTRSGQSETVTVNGDVRDFLVARNVVSRSDNIGIDAIGWEVGSAQASHGIYANNVVADVDSSTNHAYGTWRAGRCVAPSEGAAGIYDDGGRYLWITSNVVWNTNHGIELDVETPGRTSDHLLVTNNVVHDDPGTSNATPSYGSEPPVIGGRSHVAGHDCYGIYVDAVGPASHIADVVVVRNSVTNLAQHCIDGSISPVLDLGSGFSDVIVWANSLVGGGAHDAWNPLLEIDRSLSGISAQVDCNRYAALTSMAGAAEGNFATPSASWLSLRAWVGANAHGFDAHSVVAPASSSCAPTRP
jgi:hypothetical protein